MDETHVGKVSAYEKEARELFERLKPTGIILIVIGGDRSGADHYEVASAIRGGKKDLIKIPFFLMTLAQKFADDIKRLMTGNESAN